MKQLWNRKGKRLLATLLAVLLVWNLCPQMGFAVSAANTVSGNEATPSDAKETTEDTELDEDESDEFADGDLVDDLASPSDAEKDDTYITGNDEEVDAVQDMIASLPSIKDYNQLTAEEQAEVLTQVQEAMDAYNDLTEEQQKGIVGEEIFTLYEKFLTVTPSNAVKAATFEQSQTIDGITVRVTADEGVFPEDATLHVELVEDTQLQEQIQTAVEETTGAKDDPKKTVEKTMAFDITILDGEGNELQPDTEQGQVKVSFEKVDTANVEAGKFTLEVFRLNDDNTQAEKLDAEVDVDAKTVEVQAEHFSLYVLGEVATQADGDVARVLIDGETTPTYYTTLDAAITAAGTQAATITLLQDVQPSAAITIPADSDITLDLNGCTIDRGLTTPTDWGYVIFNQGTLTIQDNGDATKTGTITGGNDMYYAGGILNDGTLKIEGGSITGNHVEYGTGGGGINNQNTLTISAGIITGNTIGSGGTYFGAGIRSNGTLTISGGTLQDDVMASTTGTALTGGSFSKIDTMTSSQVVTDLLGAGYGYKIGGSWATAEQLAAKIIEGEALIVEKAPVKITTPPSAEPTLDIGKTVTLTVVTDVTEGLTYQWADKGTDITGATEASYTTTTDMATGDHRFTCTVSMASASYTAITKAVAISYNYAEPTQIGDVYQIGSASNLMWFAATANGTNGLTQDQSANAVLTADLDMAGITWSGMASYAGTFDGAGFTIQNLNSANTGEGAKGFVDVLQTDGIIENLNFDTVNVFYQITDRSAVIAGENNGTIRGCIVENAKVQCGNLNGLAGITASNSGTVENCAVLNSTFTRRYGQTGRSIGAVVDANSGTVKSCMSYNCTFGNADTAARGGIVASGTAPTNSYFYTTATTTSTAVDGIAKTTTEFASGEVAYLLNGSTSTPADGETLAWYQDIDNGTADTYPVLDNTHGTVYFENSKYTNTSMLEKPAVGDGTSQNPYELENAKNLYWFAALVNGTLGGVTQYKGACAVLKNDITVNENVLSSDGTLNGDGSSFQAWTLIGNSSTNIYAGTFDGKGHTISGLYFSDTAKSQIGLFGANKGTIQNLAVVDSYIRGSRSIGGVCGYNDFNSTIQNCSFSGVVTDTNGGSSYGNGGVCASNNGSILNCFSRAYVTSAATSVKGGVCGVSGALSTVTNCYYDNTLYTGSAVGSSDGTVTHTEGKTTAVFASGEVAWLLNGSWIDGTFTPGATDGTQVWYQNVDAGSKDDYPVLDDSHGVVYKLLDGTYSNSNVIATDDKIIGHSLTPNGTISVNFYMEFTADTIKNQNQYYVQVKDAKGTVHETTELSELLKQTPKIVTDTVGAHSCYKVSGAVAAKEMADKLTVKLMKRNGEQETEIFKEDYAVSDYFALAKQSGKTELIALTDAMAIYGAYSQQYFQYNTDTLATDLSGVDVSGVTVESLKDYTYNLVQTDNAPISYYGTSLLLEADTTLRHYFKLSEETASLDGFIFKIGEKEVSPVQSTKDSSLYYVEIENIRAKDLELSYTVAVGTADTNYIMLTNYSPITYVKKALESNNTKAGLQPAMQALYLYWKEADKYNYPN